MIATDAGRAVPTPPPPPPPGPSFLRRHPLLAGFGVLAALSLFAAYWPLSAIVTGAVVAARASGADRAAFELLRQGGRRVLDRVKGHLRRTAEQPPAAPDPPTAPEPTPEPIGAGRAFVSPPPAAALDVGVAATKRPSRTRRPLAGRSATRDGVEL